jgi:hypothetical protein
MAGLKAPFAQAVAGTDVHIDSSSAPGERYELRYTVARMAQQTTTLVVSALFCGASACAVAATRGTVARVEHAPEAIDGWVPTVNIAGWTVVTVSHTAADVGMIARVTVAPQDRHELELLPVLERPAPPRQLLVPAVMSGKHIVS